MEEINKPIYFYTFFSFLQKPFPVSHNTANEKEVIS